MVSESKTLRMEAERIEWRRKVLGTPGGPAFLSQFVGKREKDIGPHLLSFPLEEAEACSKP
ncbi:MAG: hypothetical protein WC364_15110 [Eubacteriales bacterium]|jgi:hypothetical protein